MKIKLGTGKYVVAVSGGVDSMVLLDLLAKEPSIKIIVAHINEGLRNDSKTVQQMVGRVAQKYGLPFYTTDLKLASTAEALGRHERYKFLNSLMHKTKATAIVTAHHQDDLIETAVINLWRGTNRRGLTSLADRPGLVRPLLAYSKQQLYKYARSHKLKWHEDPMNQDTSFLRNYVRHELLPKLSTAQRQELLGIINKTRAQNQKIDKLISDELNKKANLNSLDRQWFTSLPHNVAKEVMSVFLRLHKVGFDQKTLNRLTVAVKTKPAGKRVDINNKRVLSLEKSVVKLI